MTPAERRRQARYRQRQRYGLAVLPVTIDQNLLPNALIEAGLLTEAEALNRLNVARVAAELLHDFAVSYSD